MSESQNGIGQSRAWLLGLWIVAGISLAVILVLGLFPNRPMRPLDASEWLTSEEVALVRGAFAHPHTAVACWGRTGVPVVAVPQAVEEVHARKPITTLRFVLGLVETADPLTSCHAGHCIRVMATKDPAWHILCIRVEGWDERPQGRWFGETPRQTCLRVSGQAIAEVENAGRSL